MSTAPRTPPEFLRIMALEQKTCFVVKEYYKMRITLLHTIAAGVAQLVERLTCNEDVAGSTPVSGSRS